MCIYIYGLRKKQGQSVAEEANRARHTTDALALIKILLLAAVQWQTKVVHFPGGQTPDMSTLETGLLASVRERL